jgi:hypothetical protein
VGLIDYIRQYTWDKRLETSVKAVGFSWSTNLKCLHSCYTLVTLMLHYSYTVLIGGYDRRQESADGHLPPQLQTPVNYFPTLFHSIYN